MYVKFCATAWHVVQMRASFITTKHHVCKNVLLHTRIVCTYQVHSVVLPINCFCGRFYVECGCWMYKNIHTHTQQQTTITTKSTKQYPLIYLVQYKMMRRVILLNIVVLLLVQLPQDAKAWIGSLPTLKKSNTRINTSPPGSRIITLLKDTSNDSNVPIEETQTERLSKSIPQCHYKVGNKWKKRIQLHELKQGQKIVGEKISNADLLKGKTGPKSKLYRIASFFCLA